MDFWKKILGIKPKVDPVDELGTSAPLVPKTAKEIATDNREPYINVDAVKVDKNNPRYGSFDIDWNSYFIDQLKATGYVGNSDDAIIEQWFQDVCRHVVLESYEQEQADITDGVNIVRYIDRKSTGDGKTIVS